VPIDVQVIFVLGLKSRQNRSAFVHLTVLQDTSFSRIFSWFACDAEGGMIYSYDTEFLLEVLGVATLIVGIFAVIIIGAAGAFAYLVFLADDGGRIGP
jgi:hypothetical protein